jgi:TPP-dependent pyruvate/acetoin dehydrogenase alpha subunit
MHMADFSIGILGESGIVGSSMPVGVGAGLANKLRKIDRVSVCFFGDGASCEGSFHESVNLASIWKLPVVFVCENNQYAITTPYRYSIPVENIADRAVAYNIPGVLVDGQNVIAMYEATKTAVERARSGQGPTLIEGKTYRYFDHSIATMKIVRKPYRTEEEIEHWKKNRDPIQIHKDHILRNKIATEDEVRQIDEAVKREIKEAEEFARQSPYPKPEELFEDMFANPIPLE